ncbi:hypothetical protein LMH73_010290 [Vibrio splendidus]|nr:hypothetical protein [Vibrio splendidus]MCC4882742.1 hypothetical protein [Vibrio splendidus]
MKFKLLLLSALAFSAHAHVSFESSAPIYEVELNQNNEFESQLHDYLNDVLLSCGKDVVRWSRYDSYTHQFDPESNKAEMCESLFNEPLKVKCGDVMGTLQSGTQHPKAIPDEYPVIDGSDLAGNVMLAGFVGCHINDTFAKYDEKMPMFSGYSFSVEKPIFKQMEIEVPERKDIFDKVIVSKVKTSKSPVIKKTHTVLDNSVTLIPDVLELAQRTATIVVVNSGSLEGARIKAKALAKEEARLKAIEDAKIAAEAEAAAAAAVSLDLVEDKFEQAMF